jgi:ribonucleoside-diphosphate reductase beta chain
MHKIKEIRKRNNDLQAYQLDKIENAISKAMLELGYNNNDQAKKLASQVELALEDKQKKSLNYIPTVEEIQDIVEEKLMSNNLFDVAKAYILFRDKRAKERQPDIFKRRISLKPYEYPQLYEYVDSVRHSYWIHTEFNFTGDVHDFHTNINEVEKNALKRAMLAISQVEVSVKTFWSDLYHTMPKPEIGAVGATFAESEVRHHDAYSHLLEILGLNEEFNNLKDNPVIMKRIDYLEEVIANAKSKNLKKFAETLLLFSLFVEHVSLFSQFLIIMSFNKYKNLFKGISNAVEATSKEEQIHGNFGTELINIIKSEHPDWFDKEQEALVLDMCKKAYEAECEIVDWIYEAGDLSFMPALVVKEFIKNRFNNALEGIGIKKLFSVDEKLLRESEWFDDEIIGTKHGDFFVKRSINYSKRTKSITGDDLF